MTALNEKLLHDVLALPIESRAMLVEKILDSMHFGPEKKNDAVWETEIDRRIAEVESGSVELIPEDQVFDEIWQRFKK